MTNAERAMVVLLEGEGDPGEHAVDPGAQGSSDGFVLSDGQDDVPTLKGLPSTALTTTLRSPRERSVLEVVFSRCFIPESAVWPAVSGRARRWCSRW
ncbi:hypothetical protein [Streptomyces nigra]|uniref:Uncharacterized protein n=1 Tax=Streptomyces nigra TaxID=1827580 RepID=A0ABZ1JAN8_9ACTN